MKQKIDLRRIAPKSAVVICITLLGWFWISKLGQPDPFRILGSGIWMVLVHAALEDVETHKIHDSATLCVLLLGVLYCFISEKTVLHWGLGLLGNTAVMGLLYLLSRKAIGFGDVKLTISLGAFMGPWASFYLLFHASWLGALAALMGLASRKMRTGQEIPFVPFLAAGYLLAISSM